MSNIRTKIQDDVGVIILGRSEKMNAFSDAFIAEMVTAFDSMRAKDIRVVILRAEKGAKVWSAGRDIESLPTGAHNSDGWQTGLIALGNAIRQFPVPVIAMIEGSVWGFGCEVAFSCDLIVATPEATFAITPAKLGAPYPINGVRTFLDRVGANLTKEMLFCAITLDAQRLYAQGVINHVICAEEIEDYVCDMVHEISLMAPLSITALKQQIWDITNTAPFPPEMVAESDRRAARIFSSNDFREGMSALKSKRRPKFQGR